MGHNIFIIKPAYAVITIHFVSLHSGMPVRGNPLTPKTLRTSPMSDEKPTKKVRDRHIQIRLTDTEFNDIKTRAGELGTSTFLRQLALGQKIEQPKARAKKIIHAADPELVRHVAWIGNNMNQIAKHLNQGNQVDNEILMTLVKIQADLDAELQRIMSDDR